MKRISSTPDASMPVESSVILILEEAVLSAEVKGRYATEANALNPALPTTLISTT